MKTTYFIDSENVGDAWIFLAEASDPDDVILVFYTDKSPYISYSSLIKFKQSQKEITFIKCHEGRNALDFQLCTELGFRLNDIADGEFVIVSGDMGYDAIVNYWQERNVPVKRITGKSSSEKTSARRNNRRTSRSFSLQYQAAETKDVNPAQVPSATVSGRSDEVHGVPVSSEAADLSRQPATDADHTPTPAAKTAVNEAVAENVNTGNNTAITANADSNNAAVNVHANNNAAVNAFAGNNAAVNAGNYAPENANAGSNAAITANAGNNAAANTNAGNNAAENLNAGNNAAENVNAGDNVAENVNAGDNVAENINAGYKTAKNINTKNRSAKNNAVKNTNTENRTAKNINAENISTEDKAVENVNAEDINAENAAVEKAATDDSDSVDERAVKILGILGTDNLQMLHESLAQLFGAKKGSAYYNAFKTDNGRIYGDSVSVYRGHDMAEKQRLYCSAVFELSGQDAKMPDDFPGFVLNAWRKKKNLNSFRSALQTKYGKEKSNTYYSIIKSHVKILDQIK